MGGGARRARGAYGTGSAVCGGACHLALRTGTDAKKKGASPQQYVDRPSGEPARRQACRSDVSAVVVEAFVNYAGLGRGSIVRPMPLLSTRWSRTGPPSTPLADISFLFLIVLQQACIVVDCPVPITPRSQSAEL